MQENNNFIRRPDLSINDFPPSLRKLAKYMLENEDILTISEAVSKGNFNYSSITTIISREKKKGKDFKAFMNNQMQILLNNQKLSVAKALVKGAVSSSHQDRKLYFQLTGDLKEHPDIQVNYLTVGINITNERPSDTEHEPGIVDATPIIPEDV